MLLFAVVPLLVTDKAMFHMPLPTSLIGTLKPAQVENSGWKITVAVFCTVFDPFVMVSEQVPSDTPFSFVVMVTLLLSAAFCAVSSMASDETSGVVFVSLGSGCSIASFLFWASTSAACFSSSGVGPLFIIGCGRMLRQIINAHRHSKTAVPINRGALNLDSLFKRVTSLL